MKIQSVQAHLLSYPFPEPIRLSYYGGERTIFKRDAMLIRVEADKGLVGYAPGQGSQKARAAIRDVIAPFLEGRWLADPDALRVQFPEVLVVDHHRGREEAGSKTRDGLQIEHHVRGGLALVQAERLLDRTQHSNGSLDVTSGPPAAPNSVPPARLGVELGVEGNHPVAAAQGDSGAAADAFQRRAG